MLSGSVYSDVTATVPCARETGCGHSEVGEIIVLVLLAAMFAVAFLCWIQARWDRGPVAWWLRRRAAR